ncbi:MAG: AmmeMemoRadiSam system protein A [Chloroflexota bacterium]|nr:AmmeMemoRadiSam system protein A [Chloroflexota bacterium]
MSAPEHHPYVELAYAAVQAYVRERKRIKPPRALSPEMQTQAGAFVSLHLPGGELRGCIGTIQPQRANLAEEIIENAISAATRDPRFPPLAADELDGLDISVDVLTPPEPIDSIRDQDPKRHGLIVQSERDPWKRGLLLPDLETIDTAAKQLFYTRVHKAGITDPNEPVQLFRFEVKRYH